MLFYTNLIEGRGEGLYWYFKKPIKVTIIKRSEFTQFSLGEFGTSGFFIWPPFLSHGFAFTSRLFFFRFLHFVIPATIEKTKPSSVDLFLQSRFQKAYKSTIREDELSKNKSKKLIRKNTLLRSLSENARCILWRNNFISFRL